MKLKYILIIALGLCLTGGHAFAADMIAIESDAHEDVISLTVPHTAGRKIFLVPNPDRLVVDVPSVPGRHKVELPPSYHGELVKDVRFGQFDPKTSRFVFDLNHPVRVTDMREKDSKIIVTIEANAAKASAAKEPEKASSPHEEKHALKPHKPEKPMIVIDAGHGGIDPGTIGPDNIYEKDVTLAYAYALRAKLLKTGRYRVKLTRQGDHFIMLRKRVEIARAAEANLFISLHADSAPESVHGLSIYTVSEKASDKEAEALATRENKSDVLAGVDLGQERGDVASILISLAERDTMNRSATLADELVMSLDDRVHLLQNSHRFAGFAVLKAPDIPSVLIEIGFLSSEEKLLTSRIYRDRVTSGIAAGIEAYFTEQKRMGNL